MNRLTAYQLKGDPGLFGFLGKAVKGVAGGFLKGGPIGAITGGIGAIAGGGSRASRVRQPAGRPSRAISLSTRSFPQYQLPQTRTRSVGPGGVIYRETTTTSRQSAGAQLSGFQAGGGVACPKGMRPNKSSYHLRDGTFVPKGTRCVPYRRTNVGNGRALRRSMRRVEGFAKMAKRTITFTKRTKLKKRKSV